MIVFYSRSGENYIGGVIKELSVGNTEYIARLLEEKLKIPSVRIKRKDGDFYDYNECLKQTLFENENDIFPELQEINVPERLKIIYLGFPVFWQALPRAVVSFLKSQDFSAIEIRPFCTYECSGRENCITQIKKLCHGSVMRKALYIKGHCVREQSAELRLDQWIKTFG